MRSASTVATRVPATSCLPTASAPATSTRTSWTRPSATCRAGLAELREIVSRPVGALGFEEQGVLYALSEAEFLEAVQHGKWKFVKFVHLEDE